MNDCDRTTQLMSAVNRWVGQKEAAGQAALELGQLAAQCCDPEQRAHIVHFLCNLIAYEYLHGEVGRDIALALSIAGEPCAAGPLAARLQSCLLMQFIPHQDPDQLVHQRWMMAAIVTTLGCLAPDIQDPAGRVQVLKAILAAAHDEDLDIKKRAAMALGMFTEPRAQEVLLQLLHHPAPEVRQHAAAGLGHLGLQLPHGPERARLQDELERGIHHPANQKYPVVHQAFIGALERLMGWID